MTSHPSLIPSFSENVELGTGSITLYDVTDSSVIETFDVETDIGATVGQVNTSGMTLTITSSSELAKDTVYTIVVGESQITYLEGNIFEGLDQGAISFATVGTVPPTPERVQFDTGTWLEFNGILNATTDHFAIAGVLTKTIPAGADISVFTSGAGTDDTHMTVYSSTDLLNLKLDNRSGQPILCYGSPSTGAIDNGETFRFLLINTPSCQEFGLNGTRIYSGSHEGSAMKNLRTVNYARMTGSTNQGFIVETGAVHLQRRGTGER